MEIKSNVLTQDTITFGKYRDLSLHQLLKDRKYCKWLLKQPWFLKQYEYLFNRIKEHDPLKLFLKDEIKSNKDFLDSYLYFNLCEVEKVKKKLSKNEEKCYTFYLEQIQILKRKIIENDSENRYNIKAPSAWLKKFEKKTGLERTSLKDFLSENDLPNITKIVEDIKKQGGIDYKGNRSYIIAKEKSEKQELYWEKILNEKYGEDISSQYKYEKCFFDFLCIPTNTIYECKLNLKDFSKDQYRKYTRILKKYKVIYLIGKSCVIDMTKGIIYTTKLQKYYSSIMKLQETKGMEDFSKLLSKFKLHRVKDVLDHV